MEELIIEAKNGNKESFTNLMLDLKVELYKIARIRLSNNEDIEDAIQMNLLTEKDVENGYIEVANRRGIIEKFPLTSISIGVVVVEPGRFRNTLEIGEVGAQVKHQAKSISGSAYIINRRKGKAK